MEKYDVRLEYTQGLGKLADVWVGGHLLTVCDAISESSQRVMPGVLTEVEFVYNTYEHIDWQQAIVDNPGHRVTLDHEKSWSYVGYGRILQIQPVVVDFGLIRMVAGDWTDDRNLIGKSVRVPIDRLEIRHANRPDFPAAMR